MKKKLLLLTAILVLLLNVNTYAMHIMEGFLPKGWSLFWTLLMIPFLMLSYKRSRILFKYEPEKKMLIGLIGAFAFCLSALKIPSVIGSCSHPTGVGLGAILLGPNIMVMVGVIVLLFQALLLAHGGITTLGANGFSMAVVGPFISYFIYKGMKKIGIRSDYSLFTGVFIGSMATYFTTSVQLGLAFQGSESLMIAIAKYAGIFMITQVPVSIAEGILSVVVFNMILNHKTEFKLEV